MNGNQQQSSVPASQPFQVTLEAQQWNGVLAALADAPYRIAAPLVQAIGEQLQRQAPMNGEDVVGMATQPPQPH